MRATAVRPDFGASRWESRVLVYVYTIILFFASIFIYISYRASLLISDASISHSAYLETHLVTVIPEIIIWVIIARAAVRLKAYSRKVIRSEDGQALDYVANALLISIVYAILFSMSTTIKTLFVHTPYLRAATITVNHLPLLIIFISSLFLLIGTVKLNRISDVKFSSLPKSTLYSFLSLYFIAIVTYARYFRQVALTLIDDDGLLHFVMPPNALLFNYVLPYAIVWLIGLLACINLAHYANNVAGKIYRPLFKDLYIGLTMSFFGTYLIQLFDTSSLKANEFGLGLVVLIGLLLMLIKGCLLVYRGASQLSLIEVK